MRTVAIGDIHGCARALKTLLAKLNPQPEDCLIFLGDYIDGGPASREVIDTLIQLNSQCSALYLRGNHEVMMLEARSDPLKANIWHSYGGLETTFSYGVNFGQDWQPAIPESHWLFLNQTRPFLETETHIFVHACLDPQLDMQDQPDWLLYWEFVDRLIQPHKSGKRVICGHTAQRSGLIKDLGFATCIDTHAVAGGWLTGLDVATGRYWQADEQGLSCEDTL